MNLFDYKPEKMWGFPSTYSKEKKQKEFQNAIDSNNYIASEKFDGHWHRFVKQNGEVKFQSRGLSTVTNEYGDHTAHAPHLIETLNNICTGDTMLIGEAFIVGKKDRDMTKIFGCLPEKAVKRQNEDFGFVNFVIFDVLYFDGTDLTKTPFVDRIEFLKEKVKPLLNNEWITVADYFEGNEIVSRLEQILSSGGEGIVMTKKLSLPAEGARTARKTIKIKSELDNDIDCFLTGRYLPSTREYTGKMIETWEFWENIKTGEKVLGSFYESYINGETYEPITKNYYYGWPGSIEIAVLKDGEEFSLGLVSGLTEKIKQDFIENTADYIGKVCKINCMEFTPDKKCRHPRFNGFREDINMSDCTYEKVFDN